MKRKSYFKLLTTGAVIAIVLSFAIGALGQSKKDLKRSKELSDQADKLFEKKDYRGAADLYGQAILIVPNRPVAHFRKGYSHSQLKEYDTAIKELAIALSQGYKAIEVYKLQAYIFSLQKNFDSAVDAIGNGLSIEPDNVYLLKELGKIHYSRGAFPDALAAFEKAGRSAPKDGDIFYFIALVQAALNNFDGQAAAAEKAVSLNTSMLGESYFLLGDANQKKKNTSAAIQAYQRAIAAKPMNYQAYAGLSEVFRSESRFDEAIEVSKRALQYYPTDGNIFTSLSWYLSLADRPDEAVLAGQSATKYAPDQYMGYTNLCRALNDAKQYQQAIAACSSALKLKPGDGETYLYLARAYDLTGRANDATKTYSQAVIGLTETARNNPNDSDSFYLLGNALFSDGQSDKAVRAYQKCIELTPRFAKAHLNLGRTFVRLRNKPAAMEQYNALMGLDPSKAEQLKAAIDKM
jgi:tetratricopeptide (TPR) repeat protein